MFGSHSGIKNAKRFSDIIRTHYTFTTDYKLPRDNLLYSKIQLSLLILVLNDIKFPLGTMMNESNNSY